MEIPKGWHRLINLIMFLCQSESYNSILTNHVKILRKNRRKRRNGWRVLLPCIAVYSPTLRYWKIIDNLRYDRLFLCHLVVVMILNFEVRSNFSHWYDENDLWWIITHTLLYQYCLYILAVMICTILLSIIHWNSSFSSSAPTFNFAAAILPSGALSKWSSRRVNHLGYNLS